MGTDPLRRVPGTSDASPATGRGAGPARVVVTGAAGALGERVCTLAAADPDVEVVLALDRAEVRNAPPRVEARRVDLLTADIKPLFEGARTVVHLAQADPSVGSAMLGSDGQQGDVALARRVLDAAASASVGHVILLSSATVYGAWSNNAVPLTEDSALRPNPGVRYAVEKAEVERLAAEWRDEHPGARVTVLRPALTLAPGRTGWLARALHRSRRVPLSDEEPPAQFLDVNDLATAVDLVRRTGTDGVMNVAPDGWIPGDTAAALAGGGPRVRLPEPLATRIARTGWRWGLAATPPELLPYTVHPWVVANDRLRALGWQPQSTNEEAYVAAHRGGLLATLSPRRRQELALGAAGVVLAAAVAGVVVLVRRRRRRAR